MARRLKLLDAHADLCSMLERWVIHQIHSLTGGLGYPRKSLDFSYVTSPASSIDPTGFSAEDHRDTEQAFQNLCEADQDLAAAIKMYYMPWTIRALEDAGYPVAPNQTYYDRLKRAHQWMESEMSSILATRRESFQDHRKWA